MKPITADKVGAAMYARFGVSSDIANHIATESLNRTHRKPSIQKENDLARCLSYKFNVLFDDTLELIKEIRF